MSNDFRSLDTPLNLFRVPRTNTPQSFIFSEESRFNESIDTSISIIEKASEMVDNMQQALRSHEETIYNQNTEIMNLNSQKEDAFDKLLQLETVCRRESEKASKAEAQSRASNERVRALELRNASLTAQLDRMINAVSKSFSDSIDVGGLHKQLRVVP